MRRTPGAFHVTRVFAFLLAPLLLLPYGCAPAQPLERTFFAMDTVMTLRLYQGGDGSLLDQAEARVRELEGLWSVTDGTSEISTLNHDGSISTLLDPNERIQHVLQQYKNKK